ncbi:uncharacterized protein N7459_004782 [Penicillium hispanicum]|uniref:uncharacterized protein n=1 Tax=Penicillium hispanicum TaxID=1080232 RepID=UPI0025410754|nr:uncharacterized protein N7459_004782 [Penicillium hispanicum]KAJ5584982.1 hypothetical protein N7459_004782 [Penicillium hispanicum]
MSPRNSGSDDYYSSYADTRSLWNEKITLSVYDLESSSLFYAGFVFDILTLVALISFLVWACVIRNHRGQMRGVISTILSWLVADVLYVIYEIFFPAKATVTNYYVIVFMLNEFFFFLSSCLLFFVFYNLIHGYLDRLTDAGKPYATVATVHWVILALVSALSVANWGVYVALQVKEVTYDTTFHFINAYTDLDSARTIIYWIVSLEILAWSVFVLGKAGSHRFASKAPAISLVAGSVFYFALNLMYAIISIRYSLERKHFVPSYLSTVISVCQFFFCIGIVVGILLCCQNWRKLDGVDDRAPATGVQYPYDTAPVQSNQQWQQYHAYPAQDAQGVQRPHYQ